LAKQQSNNGIATEPFDADVQQMTADQFANLVRSGEGKLRVSKVILQAEGQKIRGQGVLKINTEELELDFEVAPKYQIPRSRKSIWNEEDFWRLSGVIEDDLPFTSERVSPGSRTDHFGRRTRTVQSLHLPRVDLKPEARGKKQRKSPKIEFTAVLIGCPHFFFNAGTITTIDNDFLGKRTTQSSGNTFIDRRDDYDFALIESDNGDMEVHLRSKSKFRSKGEEDDRRRFQALLAAVGFTHGFQPWPFRLTYWRNERKLGDHITAPRALAKTIHAPLDRGLGFTGGHGRKGTRNSPIRIAAKFFEKEKTLSEKLSYLLFLFRAGGAESVDTRIRTLAFCSMFEGIVDLLFDHLGLERELRTKEPQFNEYIRQRDRLCLRLKRFAGKKNSALQRIAAALEHAKAIRVRDKFRALCDHFGLNQKEMKPHLDSWIKRRNPLSHGRWDSTSEDFIDQSRIAGAINILVLKLMGYSGRMRAVAIGRDVGETYRSI
jgi:hypothetical protein